MFEFIVTILCCLVTWRIIVFFSQAQLKANLRIAIGFASDRGVPINLSVGIIESSNNIHLVRKQLLKGERYCSNPFLNETEFKSLPVGEQYGHVLVKIYEDSLSSEKRKNAPKPPIGRIVSEYSESNSDNISYLVHIDCQKYELKQLVDNKWRTLMALDAVDDDKATATCWNRITGTSRH